MVQACRHENREGRRQAWNMSLHGEVCGSGRRVGGVGVGEGGRLLRSHIHSLPTPQGNAKQAANVGS